MKLLRKHRDEIINGLLPTLMDVKERTTRIRKVKGSWLIRRGVVIDKNKKLVVLENDYVFSEDVEVPVNHKRRMREIIDKAANMPDLEMELAKYVAQFAPSKEAIIQKKIILE